MLGVEPRELDDVGRALLCSSTTADGGPRTVDVIPPRTGEPTRWLLTAAVKLAGYADEVGWAADLDDADEHGLVVRAGADIYRFATDDPATLPAIPRRPPLYAVRDAS